MRGYFSYLPNINYVSRTTDRSSNDEYIPVKNIFRRAKIRDDFLHVATAFTDYVIPEDRRPEEVAMDIYDDPRFDWVILTVNNITKVRDQWPLSAYDFRKYLLGKYGNEDNLVKTHHWLTSYQLDDFKRIVLPEGLTVDSNFNFSYLERNSNRQVEVEYDPGTLATVVSIDNAGTATDSNGDTIRNQMLVPVSNIAWETEMNDAKRRIKVLKPSYLDVVVSDMQKVMKYKKSSQYMTKRIKQAHNPRLSGS